MKKYVQNVVYAALVAGSMLSTPVLAQDAGMDPGHPRINEVDQRLQNQENRINQGVNNGTMSPRQAGRDERRDARVERQMQRDEAKHHGHITKREQRHLNRELNHN